MVVNAFSQIIVSSLVASIFVAHVDCKNDCTPQEAGAAFLKKNILNPYPEFPNDPYSNQTTKSMEEINKVLQNEIMVCAIHYRDSNKIDYDIRNFATKEDALSSDYIVTHQGRCGACSDLQDLAVYLTKTDLTTPIRKCGFSGFFSKKWATNCIKEVGFSDSCTDIWYFNTLNTRKKCFWTCMWSWMKREPFNKPDGSLNDCLQCDEDNSGPVFKYFSGRTRRNSGITSSINRPGSQVYNMTHCYY